MSGYTTRNNWERSTANLLPLTNDPRKNQKSYRNYIKIGCQLQAKKKRNL